MLTQMKNFFIIMLLLSCVAQAEEQILLIESYHPDLSWDITYKQALRKYLEPKYKLVTFSLDTKKLPPSQHAAMADKAWERYLSLQPILVILGDDPALKWLGKRFAQTKTPVVYLGVNNNVEAYLKFDEASNITGVLERPLILPGIKIYKQILPEAKRGLIILDTSMTSQVIHNENFHNDQPLKAEGITLDLKLVQHWDDWQQLVQNAKKNYDFVVIGLYHAVVDRSGKNIPEQTVIHWTIHHSKLPVFGLWDFAVGKDKALGGLVISANEQGELAAQMALEILDDKKSPEDIAPVLASKGILLFSRSGLKRYKLTLPAIWGKTVTYMD